MNKPADRTWTHRTRRLAQPLELPEGIRIAAEAREEERRQIARDLHDTAMQPLMSLVMSLTLMERQAATDGIVEGYVGTWKRLAQEALDSMRSTLGGLPVRPYASVGLPDAVYSRLVLQLRNRGLQVAFECGDWPTNVPIEWTSQLYLVVREALTNIEKHASASTVTVKLAADTKQLRVIVADNGVGFRSRRQARGEQTQPGSGFGLVSMRERVRTLGGRLTLSTAPSHGVKITVRVPRAPDVEAPGDR